MSEVLRAILDHNCLDSRPCFYAAQLIQPPAVGGAIVYSRRQLSIRCKSDSYFLAMGYCLDSGINQGPGSNSQWQLRYVASQFQIVRASNGEAFLLSAQPTGNINNCLNNFITLDEYILFDPSELIQINMDIRTNTTTAGNILLDFVTLMGVEYKMPDRFNRGAAGYG